MYYVKDLLGAALISDSERRVHLGTVKDLLLDQRSGVVRYLEIETGGWFSRERLLLSPPGLSGVDTANGTIECRLSQFELEQLPGLDFDQPVCRQFEQALADAQHAGYYWIGDGLWGMSMLPLGGVAQPTPAAGSAPHRSAHTPAEAPAEESDICAAEDSNLRSFRELSGYTAHASDREIGSLDDVLISQDQWQIQLLVIDIGSWLRGRKVVAPFDRLTDVSWVQRSIQLDASADAIEHAPAATQDLSHLHSHDLKQYYTVAEESAESE